LPKDLEALSRPITYLCWKIISIDRRSHSAVIFLDVSPAIAVNTADQEVTWFFLFLSQQLQTAPAHPRSVVDALPCLKRFFQIQNHGHHALFGRCGLRRFHRKL